MRFILSLCALVIGLEASAMIAPPNNVKVYMAADAQTDAITKSMFNQAIDLVYNHYAPIVKKKGYVLKFNRLWSDPTVNSDTDVEGKTWVINSYGGLARYANITDVATYAEVACHELGHHMGGAPYFDQDQSWPGGGPSVEGEADYWATWVCMKAVGFTTNQILIANLNLAKALATLGGEAVPSRPGPCLPDVDVTYEDHPAAQCRLNTYDAGLANAARPRCWDANP